MFRHTLCELNNTGIAPAKKIHFVQLRQYMINRQKKKIKHVGKRSVFEEMHPIEN